MNTSAIQPPKKIIKNIVRVGVILLMVYISLLAIGMGRDVIQCEGEGISNRILAIFRTASIQKEGLGLGTIVQSLLMFVLYKLYSRMLKFSQFKIIYVINALFFSLFIIIGVLFEVTGSLNLMGSKIQVAKVMILFLGSFLILYAIISTVCQEIEMSGISNKKIGLEIPYNIKRHPLLFIFGIIFLMRLPYIILSYPGRFMWDTGVQISQWFNVNPENSVYRYGEYVRLTNHHPMFHTAIMGSCIWLGKMILNSVNAGYFFFICIQYITNAAVCALTVYTILKCAVKRQSRNKIVLSMGGGGYSLAILIYYSILPFFGVYSVTGTKDTFFSNFLLLFLIHLYDIPNKDNEDSKKYLSIFMAAIGCCLSRHNGIYVIIGTLIICLFVHKHRFKKIILMLFCILIVYRGFNTLLLSAYGITGTSVSEMMSIPFQQTARYVKEYSGEVTGEEEKIISQVLNFEELSENYNPISSDPVKGTYKSDATKQDIIEYLKIWTMMFFKHPKVYMEATLNNIYGYFFSGSCAVETYTIEYSMSNISHLNESGFDFYTPQGFIFFGRILDIWCNFFYTIPLIGVLGKSYIYTWIVLFFIIRLIWSKRWYKLEIYVPAFILILVCIAGPVNGSIYFRYMYPVAIIMPLLVGRDLFADK